MSEIITYHLLEFEITPDIKVYKSNGNRLWSIYEKNFLTEETIKIYENYLKGNEKEKLCVIMSNSAYMNKMNMFNFPGNGKNHKIIKNIYPFYNVMDVEQEMSVNNLDEILRIIKKANLNNKKGEYTQTNISFDNNVVFNVLLRDKEKNNIHVIRLNTKCVLVGRGDDDLYMINKRLEHRNSWL